VAEGSQEPVGGRVLREVAVRQLIRLDEAGQLSAAHVQLTAASVGVSERTVWRWLDQARSAGKFVPGPPARFVVDDALRQRLAYWRGNVSALHWSLPTTRPQSRTRPKPRSNQVPSLLHFAAGPDAADPVSATAR
jgi:hypothetical protein